MASDDESDDDNDKKKEDDDEEEVRLLLARVSENKYWRSISKELQLNLSNILFLASRP